MDKFVAYLRVSTLEQKSHGNLELQRKDITDYCIANYIEIIKWYEDAITGTTKEREHLDDMIDDLSHETHGIIIWSLDRLSRMELLDSLKLVYQLRDVSKNQFIIIINS